MKALSAKVQAVEAGGGRRTSNSSTRREFEYRGGLTKAQQPCAGCRELGISCKCKRANQDAAFCSRKCTSERKGLYGWAVKAWEERNGRKYE